MREHFCSGDKRAPKFSVSCQHYSFAVNAFVDFMIPKGIHSVIDVNLERPRDKEKLMLSDKYRTLRSRLVKLFNNEEDNSEFIGGAGI